MIKINNKNELNDLIRKITRDKLNKIITIPKIEVTQIGLEKDSNNFLDQLNFENKIDIPDKSTINNDYKNHKDVSNSCNLIEESNNNYNPKVQNSLVREESISLSNVITNSNIIGILFKTYIVLEDINQDEFYILDQHAAHERIKIGRAHV